MAPDLKIDDYGAFDRNADNGGKNDKDGLIKRLLSLSATVFSFWP